MEAYYFIALKCLYSIIFAILRLITIITFVVIMSSLVLIAIPRAINIVNQIISNIFNVLEDKPDQLSK